MAFAWLFGLLKTSFFQLSETVSAAFAPLFCTFCIKNRIYIAVVSFFILTFATANAPVAELADALDLGSSFSRSAGSIPVRRTQTTTNNEL